MRIVPAVIPTSLRHLDTSLHTLGVFASEVQVDIVDGVFVPSCGWPFNSQKPLREVLGSVKFDEIAVELDLMIMRPEETLELWVQTGAKRIIVHAESTEHLPAIACESGRRTFNFGIAFTADTPFDILDTIDIDCVDFIQLMGIRTIGSQGQPFDERVLERIGEVKKKYPKMEVSIDGSVNKDTLPRLRNAGADRFVAGSAILNAESPEKAFFELEKIAGNRS